MTDHAATLPAAGASAGADNRLHDSHDDSHEGSHEGSTCSGGESFALRVLGDDMAPEFNEGDVIIIEPDGALRDGSFVLAWAADDWQFRQLRREGAAWSLHALKPGLPVLPLPDLSAVRGVVIQKAVPGRRRLSKRYI